MIDDETKTVLREVALHLVEAANIIGELSTEERAYLTARIAEAAPEKATRCRLFNLAALLTWAWGDALWSRD